MKNIDDYLKLAVIGAIIIIALSVAYYFVIFIPQKESQRTALQKEELRVSQQREQGKIDQEKQKQEQAKQALDTCLENAETDYSRWWDQACKSRGLLTSRCISLLDMTIADYAKEKGIPSNKEFTIYSDFTKEKSDCSCSLPQTAADGIEKSRQDRKDICLKQYPQK